MIYNPTTTGGGENYKKYVALITQDGTNAPTAIVLENTLGFTPTFTRLYAGVYQILSNGGWTENKTAVIFGPPGYGYASGADPLIILFQWVGQNEIIICTYSMVGEPADSLISDAIGLNNTLLEIRVYN
jgi:hypothetical protein